MMKYRLTKYFLVFHINLMLMLWGMSCGVSYADEKPQTQQSAYTSDHTSTILYSKKMPITGAPELRMVVDSTRNQPQTNDIDHSSIPILAIGLIILVAIRYKNSLKR